MTVPSVGAVAPDFTIGSTSGELVVLSSYRGRKNVLIAFFPLAFTSLCTEELCAFRDDFQRFESADTVVLPISVDSVPSLREFKSKYGLPIDLASDFKRDVSRSYGVLLEDRFHSQRAYFLVDTAGIIRWEHVETVKGQRREDNEILAAIASLG